MTDPPKILLADHLKTLKLPTLPHGNTRSSPAPGGVRRQNVKSARVRARGAAEGLDHVQFLARLVELELPGGVRRQITNARLWRDRERRMVARRIKAARFPATKSLDSFDFKAIPKLNSETANAIRPRERSNAGAGTGPLRMDRTAREHHRLGAQWHRQDPCCPRAGAGGLSKGPLGQLHHRRNAGPRDDGGPR